MSFFTPDFLEFFKELAPNNNKDWFDIHRKRYEKSVKIPFQQFVQHLINRVAETEKEFADLEPKDCIFRINRDIRFSNDKTPYKLNVSAVVAPEGKKSRAVNGVYFELGPEYMRVYGGIYEIDKDDLLLVREGIADNPEVFKKLYTAPTFKKLFGEILGEKNKILPPHLKEAAISEPLIYHKQWYFYTEFPAATVLRDDLDEIILNCFEVGKPLEQFFNGLIQR